MQTVYHNAYHNDPYAKEFGIRISEKLASVEARILPPPRVNSLYFLSDSYLNFTYSGCNSLLSIACLPLQLKYHDTGREKDCLPQVGQWNMMNKVFLLLLLYTIIMVWDAFHNHLCPVCILSLLSFFCLFGIRRLV